MLQSALTSKGQATIPKAVRDHLKLKPGDRVRFFIHPDGGVVLLPVRPAAAARGILRTTRRVTLAQMDDAVAAGAAARIGRARVQRR